MKWGLKVDIVRGPEKLRATRVANWWETYDELHCGWFFLCSTRENTTYLRGDVVCFYSGALPRPNEPTWGGGTTIALHTDPFHQCRSTLSDPLFGVPLTAESFHFRQLAMTPWKFSNFFFCDKESVFVSEERGGKKSKSPYKIDPVCCCGTTESPMARRNERVGDHKKNSSRIRVSRFLRTIEGIVVDFSSFFFPFFLLFFFLKLIGN